MIYGIIFVTMLFLIVGSVRYIGRHLIPKNANKNKKYMIDMENAHMYCYLLSIRDEIHTYKAIIEAGTDDESMLIWLEDFNFPQAEIEDIKKEIELYFIEQNIRCIFKPGNRIKE